MAKYKAIRHNIFRGHLHEKGVVIETDGPVTEHFKLIEGEPYKEPEKKQPKQPDTKTPYDDKELSELHEIAKGLGLKLMPNTGKPKVIKAILQAEEAKKAAETVKTTKEPDENKADFLG